MLGKIFAVVFMRTISVAAMILSLVCIAATTAWADTVTNGNFETQSLAGFTIFTTPDGTNGVNLPSVAYFNTKDGVNSYAAHFNVATTAYAEPGGGGLSQVITIPVSGYYLLQEDFASTDLYHAINVDAGTFSILINGLTVVSSNLGGFTDYSQTLRGSFSDALFLASGSYTLQTEITRIYTTVIFPGGSQSTPDEYIDNLSLSPLVVTTPEPSSIVLLGTGTVALVGSLKRRSTRLESQRSA